MKIKENADTIWHKKLENKELVIKENKLKKQMQGFIVSDMKKWEDGDVSVNATRYDGKVITIKCNNENEIYRNIAILNGYTIE